MGDKHKYFAVSVTAKKEEKALQAYLEILNRREAHGIYSVILTPKIKGYVIIEADDLTKVKESIRKVPNLRGVISQEIPFDEIERYIDVEYEETINVNERDIIEIISGPFKGYRGKVMRISPNKNEIIVELIDIPNPIPITLGVDDLKVLEKNEENEE